MVNCFISRHAHMHECVDGKMLWFYQDTVSDIHAVDIFNRLAAKCSLHCPFSQVHKFTHYNYTLEPPIKGHLLSTRFRAPILYYSANTNLQREDASKEVPIIQRFHCTYTRMCMIIIVMCMYNDAIFLLNSEQSCCGVCCVQWHS